MGDTDVTFRHLLRGAPQPFLRLAFPRHHLQLVGPFDPSVDRARQLTADSLFRVRNGEHDRAMHVEVEREWRPTIPLRLFDYASAAVTATQLPVTSIVMLLRPGGQPPLGSGVHRVSDVDGDTFVFRYHVVPLWQLDAREVLSQLGLAAAPYCVAMQGSNEALVRSLADQVLADDQMAWTDRNGTMRLLYLVSASILGVDTARRIFHVDSIIQDPSVQELIKEWEDSGRAKGRVEGHAEGMAEGRASGIRTSLFKVLARRSLPVTPDVRARIDSEPDGDRLEAWLDAAVTATAIGDVFRDG